MKLVSRTAEVWHPIEELNSFLYLVRDETDPSLSQRQRIALLLALQFRADASESFQGAGSAVWSRHMEIGLRFTRGSFLRRKLKGAKECWHNLGSNSLQTRVTNDGPAEKKTPEAFSNNEATKALKACLGLTCGGCGACGSGGGYDMMNTKAMTRASPKAVTRVAQRVATMARVAELQLRCWGCWGCGGCSGCWGCGGC
eukprot:s574_g13.t1